MKNKCNEWLQTNNKEWEKRNVKRKEEYEKMERLEKANRLSKKRKIEVQNRSVGLFPMFFWGGESVFAIRFSPFHLDFGELKTPIFSF